MTQAGAVAATGAAGAGAAARPVTEIPAPRPIRVADDDEGPLLDGTGLLLAVVALIALAGLIPLWGAVRGRLQPSQVPIGFLQGDTVLVPADETLVPVPTPTPTVVIVMVPLVTGQSDIDAEEELRRQGLASTTILEPSDTSPPGQVIRQSPPAGSSVSSATVVELVVSGEPSIEIPPISGDWATVSQTLEQYGFVPVQRFQWGGAGSQTAGSVISLNPPPGNHWRRGAPVYVTIDSGAWLPLGVDFDDNIHLSGVELPRAQAAPGEQLAFVAHWEATDTSDFDEDGAGAPSARADYIVRAVLIGADGQAIASDEHVPVGGARPTSSWQPGEAITDDVFTLALDPAAPAGPYTLWLDLYPAESPDTSLGILHSASRVAFGDRVRVMTGIDIGGGQAEE